MSYDLILFFDICSSSQIIESLGSEKLDLWRTLLNELDEFLETDQTAKLFKKYKFLGDGWVVLGNASEQASNLIDLIGSLRVKYHELFSKYVSDDLLCPVDILGLSFGAYVGIANHLQLKHSDEYIGPALNIASRLQSSISNPNDKKDHHGDQLLMLQVHYKDYFKSPISKKGWKVEERRERTLRNINNNKAMYCARIWL